MADSSGAESFNITLNSGSMRGNDFLTPIPGESQVERAPAGRGGPRGSKYMFQGEIENARSLIPVLKAICIKRTAVMIFTDNGLKITCEEESCTVQASVFLDRKIFKKYDLKDNNSKSLCFRMSDLLSALKVLLPELEPQNQDAINEHSNFLCIKYETIERLKLQVISGNHSAMATIQTFDPQELVVFSSAFVNKIIVDASVIIDFWKAADTTSPTVEVKISNGEHGFEMITESELGKFRNCISGESSHVEHFECTVPMGNKYEMDSMKATLRPLLLATKMSIRLNASGHLNMQFLIRLDTNLDNLPSSDQNRTNTISSVTASNGTPSSSIESVHKCVIEFYIVPKLDVGFGKFYWGKRCLLLQQSLRFLFNNIILIFTFFAK